MKHNSLKCKFNPLCDSSCERMQMPLVTRSETELTNFPKGKMPAPNFLRLNSVGEVTAESFPEKAVGKRTVGISKSLDSVSPIKNFSSGIRLDIDCNNMHQTGFTIPATGPRFNGKNHSQFSNTPRFAAHSSHMLWPPFSSQFGMYPYNQSFLSHKGYYNNFGLHPFCPVNTGYNNMSPLINYPYAPRIPGLLPGAMFTAMTAFPKPNGACKTPSTQCLNPFSAFSMSKPSKMPQTPTDSEAEKDIAPNFKSNIVNEVDNQNDSVEVCSSSIESHVDNLRLDDPVSVDLDLDLDRDMKNQNAKESVDTQKSQEKESVSINCRHSHQKDNNLKRRNEKMEPMKTGSTFNSKGSVAVVINDNDASSVLFQRKTPKKGRPSCKKRKKRQHQRASFSSQSGIGQKKDEPVVSKCASPSKSPSSVSSADPTLSPVHSSIKSHLSSSKSRPACVARLFCSPNSDSELSDDDIDDCDSVKLTRDYPSCLSPFSNLGSSLSFDALFKPKNLRSLDVLLNDSVKSDPELDHQSESPSASPGAQKSIRFSFSIGVSEDEESESSFDSFSSSPSEQVILDLEFGTGLSLEAIIGRRESVVARKSGAASSPSAEQCFDSENLSSEQEALLMRANLEWNKHYPSLPLCSSSSTDKAKVQFACEEDLVQVHIVGNEERRGTWFEDGQRFQKRIRDVEYVLSHVLSESHREKIRQSLDLS